MNVLTNYPAKSNQAIAINIYDILGESVLLGEDQGNIIYQIIAPALKSGKNVILSFNNIERFTWSFASKAIAQLYEHFKGEERSKSAQVRASLPFIQQALFRLLLRVNLSVGPNRLDASTYGTKKAPDIK